MVLVVAILLIGEVLVWVGQPLYGARNSRRDPPNHRTHLAGTAREPRPVLDYISPPRRQQRMLDHHSGRLGLKDRIRNEPVRNTVITKRRRLRHLLRPLPQQSITNMITAKKRIV